MSLSQFCDLKEELYTAANAEPRLKGIIFLIHAKPRTKSLPGSREHNECPMRSASPPYGNFESFHTADRNLLRERLKPFTSAPQTYRSTAPNPFTRAPETCHIPRPHSLARTRTTPTPTGTRHSRYLKLHGISRALCSTMASFWQTDGATPCPPLAQKKQFEFMRLHDLQPAIAVEHQQILVTATNNLCLAAKCTCNQRIVIRISTDISA